MKITETNLEGALKELQLKAGDIVERVSEHDGWTHKDIGSTYRVEEKSPYFSSGLHLVKQTSNGWTTMNDHGRFRVISRTPSTVEQRLAALEAHSHEPFDFTHMIERIERLEASLVETPVSPEPVEILSDTPTQGFAYLNSAEMVALASPKAPVEAPFGTYIERNDGVCEFRRTGEPHTPAASGYKFWTLYASPIEAPVSKEALDDCFSHRGVWRSAISSARDRAVDDDRSYWQHELKAFDRTMDILAALSRGQAPTPVASPSRESVVLECIAVVEGMNEINKRRVANALRSLISEPQS